MKIASFQGVKWKNMKIRFATIGTSKITEKFLQAAACCEDFCLYAVYSRDLKKAEAFAEKHGAVTYYNDLDALAADESVDAVYIASPNHLHCTQAVRMMGAGKHVLCEKALASNAKEAKQMIQTSKEKNVVLMEAMRSVHDPGFDQIAENIKKLGKIRRVTFRYCQYSSRYDNFKEGQPQNIFDRNCSAGALMDIGVYCVYPMIQLFGEPVSISASAIQLNGGIDGIGTIVAAYRDMLAELIYSKITASDLPSEIQGEKGRMLIWSITDPRKLEIQYYHGENEVIEIPGAENNMQYEVPRFLRAVQRKADVSIYLQTSQQTLELMDEARRQTGIVFPADNVSGQR